MKCCDKQTKEELERLAEWVRKGDYDRDDARDEIARAIEFRAHAYADLDEVVEKLVASFGGDQ